MAHLQRYAGSLALAVIAMFAMATAASADTLYGSLFQVGHLEADSGTNRESVLMYLEGTTGYVAVTTNSSGSEWWTATGRLGLNWSRESDNPLEDYGCVHVGRHSVVMTDDATYFGAQCDDGPQIFELTALDEVTLVHTLEDPSENDEVYPTAATIGDDIYMFFNSGYTHYDADADTWTDVTDADGQPGAVPLEASSEVDGLVYLPYVDGDVYTFDGETFTQIGEDYLESTTPDNPNLPSVEAFNDTAYVGNQDFDNGATLFKYDADAEEWDTATDLDAEDQIINKSAVADVDGTESLVFYTANGSVGTTVYAIDEDDNVSQIIDSGLGGTNPENNTEVISTVNRTVRNGLFTEDIQMFSTKNPTDETKLFVLSLGTDFAFSLVTSVSNRVSTSTRTAEAKNFKKVNLEEGKSFRYKIKKSKVQKRAVYTLWVNGEKVDRVRPNKRKKVVLRYPEAKTMDEGDTFNVKVGVRRTYGVKKKRRLARNTIKGKRMKVTVTAAE